MTAGLIDIGCNLSSPRLRPDVERIRKEAQIAGVAVQILTGADEDSNRIVLELATKYPDFFATVGFHPHHAAAWHSVIHKRQLIELATQSPVVAVGEMGLDYFRQIADVYLQHQCFIDQLEVAVQVQKPVFLHERDAFDDFCAILTPYLSQLPGAVWHCFTGNHTQLEWALSAGLFIGITGWICDPVRGALLREVVRDIPDDKLMIETDSPYLTPKTLQPTPRTNEPKYLIEVLKMVASCRKQTCSYVAEITTRNAYQFFQLPLAI